MFSLPRVLRIADWQPTWSDETLWRRDLSAIEDSGERQIERHAAERFARAMELLGDEKVEVRWGGIFALEKLARRSPQEQSAVSDVLATYVRRRARWQPEQVDEETVEDGSRISSEIQLILTVLARREYSFRGEDKPLDLHNTNLAKVHLPFAHLERAFLYNCNLQGALLYQAHLQGAWLARTNLKNANLDGAHLEGADLSDAISLTPEQLELAYWDTRTTMPHYLAGLTPPKRRRR